MRKLNYLFVFIALFLLVFQQAYGQQAKSQEDYTPYDFMSSYYNDDFSPFKKHTGYVGLAFSLQDQQRKNTTGLVQNVVDGQDFNYNLLFKGGLYTQDYNMIGLNFNYYQNKFIGTVFRDPDTVQVNSLTRGYEITPNLRSSIPLTANERFSFFVELDLLFGYSNSLSRQTTSIDEITKNYGTNYYLGAGISPGLTFFAMQNFAFEVQLNVLGYKFNVNNSTVDGDQQEQTIKHNVNLSIDLLTMDLGLAYYF